MLSTRERETDILDGVYKGEGYRYLGWRLQGTEIHISRMVCTRERDTDI